MSSSRAPGTALQFAGLVYPLRMSTAAEGDRITSALGGYRPQDGRIQLEFEGGVNRPPMEPTPASQALFEKARAAAERLGFALEAARVGGASDGNLTAAAGVTTLDGLGPTGGGAHARREHVAVSDLPRRAALLAALLAEG